MPSTSPESAKAIKQYKSPAAVMPPYSISITSWTAYLELARVQKPAGTLAFHVPLSLGSLVAIVLETPQPRYLAGIIFSCRLVLSSFFLRSAACAWNDACDHKFDRQVARSRSRPIPRGSVSPAAARLYTVILALLWVLSVWPSGSQALTTLLPNSLFNAAYPYTKRITDYPQVFLGLVFSWNVLTGYAMTTQNDLQAILQDEHVWQSLGFLILAVIAWTIFFDFIYAFQDIEDDERAGVKSMTLRWKTHGKLVLALLSSIQVCSLVAAGMAIGLSSGYFSFSCAGSAAVSALTLISVELEKPKSCALWFKNNLLFGGVAMCSGFLVEYIVRIG
ncbi:Para-hydroxybenzoate--polyprenyltransferase, mitochondrial precursor (PHB:polyprenyltransferase) [Thelotrema lepadinum]|nr:Para-hydroxybenzoate--polyprenyltransferase, mitochondrial precursor (PHB:polyprenyltransferase) [Thelotrema lepadinum]